MKYALTNREILNDSAFCKTENLTTLKGTSTPTLDIMKSKDKIPSIAILKIRIRRFWRPTEIADGGNDQRHEYKNYGISRKTQTSTWLKGKCWRKQGVASS